jgi:hypothetical protein
VSHRNAALTPAGRLKLARVVVDDGWPIYRAAERFQVSWHTAARWADPLLELRSVSGYEEDGLCDRSSRPHRSPTQTRRAVVKEVAHGPAQRYPALPGPSPAFTPCSGTRPATGQVQPLSRLARPS